jgi:hypothetical protein
MKNTQQRAKSIALKGSPQLRAYRTFEDWQAEQRADLRTPEQRGIHVGSPVMWRHRTDQFIVTERAVVTAIDDNMLTLKVKDVETRNCSVDIGEIVTNEFSHISLVEASRRAYLANQMESTTPPSTSFTDDDLPPVTSWL